MSFQQVKTGAFGELADFMTHLKRMTPGVVGGEYEAHRFDVAPWILFCALKPVNVKKRMYRSGGKRFHAVGDFARMNAE